METDDANVSQTNCFVMLHAPRSMTSLGKDILPRMAFKVIPCPRGSRHVCLRFLCEGTSAGTTTSCSCKPIEIPQVSKHKTSKDQKDFEQDKPVTRDTEDMKGEDTCLASLLAELQLVGNDRGCTDEYIWFQVSTLFCGFRELPHARHRTHTCKQNAKTAKWNDHIWADWGLK